MAHDDSIRTLLRQVILTELGLRAAVKDAEGTLADYAARAVADACDVPLVGVFEHDEAGLRLQAGVGWPEPLLGRVVVCAGDPHASDVLATDAAVAPAPMPEGLRAAGAAAGLSVRVGNAEAPLGVLGAYTRTAGALGGDVAVFLEAVATVLAGALERARAERAIREGAARIQSILDTADEGIVTVDGAGRIESFNAAAERIFGYAEAEVLGQRVHRLLPASQNGGPPAEGPDGERVPITDLDGEMLGRRKDGASFPMEFSVRDVGLPGRRLYTCLVRDVTEQRALENEVLRIADAERRRIGQDLHDGLGQLLTGITLIAQSVARKIKRGELPPIGQALEVVALLRQADAYARSLARGLVPVDLEADGLRAALERLAANAEHFFDVRCVVRLAGEPSETLPEAVPLHLFRIAQEAVSNAVRHGRARRIVITLAYGADHVRLRVADDGRGYPAPPPDEATPGAPAPSANRGMGVRIMRHRAHVMGGRFEIRAGAGRGTGGPGTGGRPGVPCPVPRPLAGPPRPAPSTPADPDP